MKIKNLIAPIVLSVAAASAVAAPAIAATASAAPAVVASAGHARPDMFYDD